MVNGPLPVAVPPCEGGRWAAVRTVASVVVMPFGWVTTVCTVSPTRRSDDRVTTMGVPPALAASLALTPFGDSGRLTDGAEGALVSSVKPPLVAALVLPATSVIVVLVVHAPFTVNALLGISWLIVNGPFPLAVPPCEGGRSAALNTVVSVLTTPFGLVTTVCTVSPTRRSGDNVTTTGVPPALAASAALTPLGDSGRLTDGVEGAEISSVKPPLVAALALPATSVIVVLVVHAPLTVSALPGTSWLIVNGPLPLAVPPCEGGRSAALNTVVSVLTAPFGSVTTVLTVSPTRKSGDSVTTTGVPPALAASAALTPLGDSGRLTAGADGALMSSVNAPLVAALALPATSVIVVLVVHAPFTVSALLGMIWLIVNGPLPLTVPPCEGGRSAVLNTVVSVLTTPFGLVTTVLTVSPTRRSDDKVTTMGVPPALAASAALTPLGDSGRFTDGVDGAEISSVKPPATPGLVFPATSIKVVLVVHAPSMLSALVGMS